MNSESDRRIEFSPVTLSETFRRRLDHITDELLEYPQPNQREVTLKEEIRRIEDGLSNEDPSKEKIRYLAVLEVLLDLIEINYGIEKNSKTYVVRPDLEKFRKNPEQYKERERSILEKEREVQFKDESVKRFIIDMELETPGIPNLVAKGEELYQELKELQDLPREVIVEELDDLIQPYVQLVVNGKQDTHTGLDLMDIWRYFRYTWLTPYHTVPGRNINFLLRDAAREYHPVMGIASLASPMMNMGVRDQHIGWVFDEVKKRLNKQIEVLEYEEQLPKEERTPDQKTRLVTRTTDLETEEEHQERIKWFSRLLKEALENQIHRSLNEVRFDDFLDEYPELTKERLLNPDDRVFEILNKIHQEAKEIIDDPEIEEENPDKLDSWKRRSETPLFRKKRAENLRKLLRDRRYFVEHANECPVDFIKNALNSSQGTRALKTALLEVKKRRVGSAMMNIMVCGAIPPYNEILGGKLVAMALTGPEIINAYREKYADSTSEIASSMKGEPVKKLSELVFLDTTSLFEVGTAQYDRVRVPVGDNKIEYEKLGMTKGYGSIQFGPKTRLRLSQVTKIEEGKSVVHGRFGEGVAPRMRKIRRGLDNLGLSGELLRHESRRVVYGVDLVMNLEKFLFGVTDEPDYFWDFSDMESEQQSIYDYWKRRWVSKRVQKDFVLDRIREFQQDDVLLQNQVTINQKRLSDFIVDG